MPSGGPEIVDKFELRKAAYAELSTVEIDARQAEELTKLLREWAQAVHAGTPLAPWDVLVDVGVTVGVRPLTDYRWARLYRHEEGGQARMQEEAEKIRHHFRSEIDAAAVIRDVGQRLETKTISSWDAAVAIATALLHPPTGEHADSLLADYVDPISAFKAHVTSELIERENNDRQRSTGSRFPSRAVHFRP